MKKRWIVLASLTVLLLFVIVLFLNVNAVIRRNKDRLLERAAKSVGRRISVESVGVSFRGGIGVRLEGFSVSDDPSFSEEAFVEAEALNVRIAFIPLLERKLEIESATLISPTIRVVRNDKGRFNFDSLAGGKREEASRGEGMRTAFAVALFDIDDGRVVFSDRLKGIELEIDEIDSRVEDFELGRPFEMELEAALFSEHRNLAVRVRVEPTESPSLESIEAQLDAKIDGLDMERLKRSLGAAVPGLPPGMEVKGVVDLELTARLSGGSVSCEGRFGSPSGRVGEVEYSSLRGGFGMKDERFSMEEFSLDALGGEIEGSIAIELGAEPPAFSLKSRMRGLRSSDLLRALAGEFGDPVEGELNIDVELSGAGTGRGSIERTLAGTGVAGMEGGRLVDFNIVSRLFESLSAYPGVAPEISERLGKKYPRVFETRDTEFRSWSSDFLVREGKLLVRNLVLEAPDFTLKGKGYLGIDKRARLDLVLVASERLGEDLVAEVPVLDLLRDERGRVAVPLVASGTLPGLRIAPDERAVREAIEKSLLEKGLKSLKKGLQGLVPPGGG